MACQTIYEDMMSLQLDGMLGPDDRQRLQTHLAGCTECTVFWGALKQANDLLAASIRDPAPVPAGFSVKVMARIAASPEARTYRAPAVATSAGAAVPISTPISVLPPRTRPHSDDEQAPILMPDFAQDWQERVAAYVRGVTAVALAAAAAFGLLLVLVISGVLQVGDAFAPAVQLARTFFDAAAMWFRSLLSGVGTETAGVLMLVGGGVALAGWQIVSNYYRSAREQQVEATAEVGA